MNTKEKGDISQAIILAELLKAGFSVSIPWGDKDPYDLILETKEGDLKKIQCKTGYIKRSCVKFKTSRKTTKNGKVVIKSYGPKEVDEFIVYSPQNNKIYRVPYKEAPSDTGMLRLVSPKNNQKNGIKMASDYEWSANNGKETP